jgi:long-chain acyl-CoA synthetase
MRITDRYRSTGPAITGVELKIENPNPETGEGEIVARGQNVMRAYYKAPELTAEVLTEDGWFRTGDLGVLDEDGYLFIKGRLKNMLLGPSGENIYPEEIEAIICEHDFVVEVVVYKQQEQLVARVHLDYEKLDERFSRQKLSEVQIQQHLQDLLEELRKTVNARVSSFSRINRMIEQSEPFEKTPTKKIKRYLYTN